MGEDNGHHIGELKGLNLRGELSIQALDNVKNLRDAKCANLIGKRKLQSLSLSWREDKKGNLPENAEEVLSGLQPHSNLKELNISSYQGSKFPDWMMDSHFSFSGSAGRQIRTIRKGSNPCKLGSRYGRYVSFLTV